MKPKIVIPARYSSSRLPGKPLLEISGKPIVWHVVQRCIEAGFSLDDIIVATDDMRIESILEQLDIQVVMTSNEHQSGSDRIHEVATLCNWSDEIIVINVQGDEPLIPQMLIRMVAQFAKEWPEYSITTAVTPIVSDDDLNNPNVVKAIIGNNGRALYFTRSASPFCRDNPESLDLAYRHIGIYSYRVSALREFCSHPEAPLENYEKLEQLRALSNGMSVGVTKFNTAIPHGVDTIDDYEQVKNIMESK